MKKYILLILQISVLTFLQCSLMFTKGMYPCNTLENYAEINEFRLKLNTVLPNTWIAEEPFRYCPDDGGMCIRSTKQFNFENRGKQVFDHFSIHIQFLSKYNDEHINNKIKQYDSICIQMKKLYSKIYPNWPLLKSPFFKLAKDGLKDSVITLYNQLSTDLWLNENEFPKHYTTNYDVIIFTTPDLYTVTDTTSQYAEFKEIHKIVEGIFPKYQVTCNWDDN